MEVKFGFLERRIKTIDIKQDEISQKNNRLHAFFAAKVMKEFWKI
jgi:hypothetical protein